MRGVLLVVLGAIAGLTASPAALAVPGDACPNASLRERQGASILPDCRAYEMVSPTDKAGGGISQALGQVHASPSGDRIVYESRAGFAGAEGTGKGGTIEYVAQREVDGWRSKAVTPKQAPTLFAVFVGSQYTGFDEQLTRGVTSALNPPLVSSAPANSNELYLRDLATGEYQHLSAAAGPIFPSPFAMPVFADATPDFERITFASPQPLTGAETGSGPNLYEWSNGELDLASVLPDGSPAPSAVPGSWRSNSDPSSYPDMWRDTGNTISDDGSRISFTAPAGFGDCVTPQRAYQRVDSSTTIDIAGDQGPSTDPRGPRRSTFEMATSDGKRVFFSTDEQLIPADADEAVDLYRWDADAPAGSRLTLASPDAEPADDGASGLDDAQCGSADVMAVLSISDDGSVAYFMSVAELVAGQAGGPAIYRWEDGDLSYVAAVNGISGAGFSDDVENRPGGGGWMGVARGTRDGRYLLYVSRKAQPGSPDNGGTGQLYRYDALAGTSTCVSCRPDGQPSTASSRVGHLVNTPEPSKAYLPRALSSDGGRIVFETTQSLSPADTNGRMDVYLWDDGDLSVISPGSSDHDAFFADADLDADTIFFRTTERLSGWDRDGAVDLYGARTGGGLPEPPDADAPCLGDDCQGDGSKAPATDRPASERFSGRGNGGQVNGAKPATIRLRMLGTTAQLGLARRGRLGLRVRVGAVGRLSVRANARVGGRVRLVGQTIRSVRRAGELRIVLRLSRPARLALERSGRLRVRLVVRHSRARAAEQTTLKLRR